MTSLNHQAEGVGMIINHVVGWVAFVLVLIVLSTGPRPVDLDRVQARLGELEGRKCTLMAVSTPNGVSAICAGLQ